MGLLGLGNLIPDSKQTQGVPVNQIEGSLIEDLQSDF